MTWRCFRLMLLLVGVLAMSAQAGNLLSNSGFETGSLDPWWTWEPDDANQDVTVQGTIVYSGSYAAELWTNSGDAVQLGQTVDLPGGKAIGVSLMYYDGEWAGAGIAINYYDASWTYIDYAWVEFKSSSSEGSAEWTAFSASSGEGAWTTPAGTEHADFRIDQWGWGTMDVDDVVFTPEPTTIALLALGGLTLLRRRRGDSSYSGTSYSRGGGIG